ncbi:hypothetical protein QT971_09195 [Microcoleus sp. herbarium19]|uniref:hypothetical protein n=1 Tax=unclassified Microcoleus TaxID=2642155 RepID=UPI002FD1C474
MSSFFLAAAELTPQANQQSSRSTLGKSYTAGCLCFGMSIGQQRGDFAGSETSSRLAAAGTQNLIFIFYRLNYPEQPLKSPPAVR